MNKLRIASFCSAYLLLASQACYGQTFWTAGVDDWFDAGNWTLGAPDANSGVTFDAVIANGGTAEILAPGASVFRLRVGRHEGPGHLLIDGGDLTVTGNLHLNEGSAGSASVIVQGGSTVTAPATVVGHSSSFGTSFLITGAGTVYNATTSFEVGRFGSATASLNVEDGALLASGTSSIAAVNGSSGGATVTGAGSRWSTTGAFTVGSAAIGILNIQDEGTIHVGTALTIGSTSNVNLSGGTLRFNTISGIGRVNYASGTLQLAGNRDIVFDSSLFDFYGASRIIPSGKGLKIEGTTTIRQDKSLTVSGGTFTSQGVLTLGAPGVSSGDLIVNNGGAVVAGADVKLDAFGLANLSDAGSSWTVAGSFQVSPTGGRGDLFISNEASLNIANTLSIGSSGFVTLNGGSIRFNGYSRHVVGAFTYTSGTIQLAGNRTIGSDAAITDLFGASPALPTGKALVVEGTATLMPSADVTLSGGSLSANTVLLTPGSRLVNTQTAQVHGAMLALAGSEIDATGADLDLGDGGKVNGFYGNGTIQAGSSTVTLADANDAVLDAAALVALGSGGSPGTLAAANGLTLNFGGNVTGHGAVDTPDNAAKPFINNGNLTGASLAEPITLPGYVKGVGTFDNVEFTGTFAPGFSPASVNLGSASYNGVLDIEIGGLSPGSGHDQLNHILGEGVAHLGGALNVTLINGFAPSLNDAFEIITAAGGIENEFENAVPIALGGGLAWDVVYGENSVLLKVVSASLSADYDVDGDVDGNDFLVWQRGGSTNGLVTADLDAWQSQYGVANAAVSRPVPEPAGLVIALIAVTALGVRSRVSAVQSNAL